MSLNRFSQLLMLSPLIIALAGNLEQTPDAAPPKYKIKKVCHSREVPGTAIPRTTCVKKKIPVKDTGNEAEQPEGDRAGDASNSDEE